MITTEQIKNLRDSTGVSVMQCKKALEEAGGDVEKALIILRKKSGEIAAKKLDRTFGAGVIASYIHSNAKVGVMVELVCETDFVSGNDEFKTLARDIAMHIAASNPKFVRKEDIGADERAKAEEVFAEEVKGLPPARAGGAQAGKPDNVREKILEGKLNSYFAERILLEQPFIKNPEITIKGLIDGAIQKFGEKIDVARFARFGVLEK